jgi:hypothetical protein
MDKPTIIDKSIVDLEQEIKKHKINGKITGKIKKIKNVTANKTKITALFYVDVKIKNKKYFLKKIFTMPINQFSEMNDTKKIILNINDANISVDYVEDVENGTKIFVIFIIITLVIWCVWMVFRRYDYYKNLKKDELI